MRFPRVRFTVRRLMISVVVVGIVSAAVIMARRRAEYESKASYHAVASMLLRRGCSNLPSRPSRAAWHDELRLKYGRAARYPFLPVAPDPPEPE